MRALRPSCPPRSLATALALGVAVLATGTRGALAEPKVSPAVMARAWRTLAEKGTDEAFRSLADEYGKLKDETLRGLLVSTVTDAVTGDAALDRLAAWRASRAEPRDAWLWHRVLLREYARSPQAVRAAVDAEVGVELRAAAIRALATWADPDALDLVPAAVRRQWGEGAPGALLVEAWAAVVGGQPGRAGTAAFKQAVYAIVEYLETQRPSAHTSLSVARSLAKAFETDDVYLDPLLWKSMAERVDAPKDREHEGHTASASATFFDLDATGDRVVYLLDASNSMDDPLERETVAALERLAGPARATDPPLDWRKVTTARHAVIEVTKRSLRALRPAISFCVVLFGDDARTLPTTPGLVPATPSNVAAACRDLDAARRSKDRGLTNLHGGLRVAFGVAVGGRDPRALASADPLTQAMQGASTLFILSDGVPSRDDWDDTGNVAIGKPLFAEPSALVEDFARANLLRGCELHAVALGAEAHEVLRRLAREGNGHTRVVPAPPPVEETCDVPPLPAGPLRNRVDAILPRLGGPDAAAAIADLHGLFPQAATALERTWLAHCLAARGDFSVRGRLLEALEDPKEEVAATAEAGLRALGRRSFGPVAGLTRPERAALRRNWTWWWETHPDGVKPSR